MKKILVIMLIAVFAMLALTACSGGEGGDIIDDSASEVTLYANGGTIWMGTDDLYDADLSTSSIDKDTVFKDAIDPIDSVKKDGAEFNGWKVYIVTEGEWTQEEPADLEDGHLVVPCGEYGYYYMKDYEIADENATTEELMGYKASGKDYYALATWK